MSDHHAKTQTHSRVPLPVDSVVHLRKQHPNSAGPPPPVFLHTEVPLQIPAVTAAPALALQLGIIRRWRAAEAHYPSPWAKLRQPKTEAIAKQTANLGFLSTSRTS